FRVRVVENESLAHEIGVVVENRTVQVQQALLVDKQLGPIRSLEHFVAETGLLLPGKGVAQARAPTAFDAYAQPTVVDALLGHQRPDPARRNLRDLDHFSYLRWAHPHRLSRLTSRFAAVFAPTVWPLLHAIGCVVSATVAAPASGLFFL